MKIIESVRNYDVGGVFTFNDGCKLYWDEGRSSKQLLVHPDGTQEWLDNYLDWDEEHMRADRDGLPIACHSRPATEEEELHWAVMRAPR